MANPLLIKTKNAEGAITGRRIVKPGVADHSAAQGGASTDALNGINEHLDVAAGGRCDIIKAGIADVEYGGTVAYGDPLTSDATGRAVKAAPAAGVNANTIGKAEIAGVVGDFGLVLIAPGTIQG